MTRRTPKLDYSKISHKKIDVPPEVAPGANGKPGWLIVRTRFRYDWLSKLDAGPLLIAEMQSHLKFGETERLDRETLIAGVAKETDFNEAELQQKSDDHLRIMYDSINNDFDTIVESAKRVHEYADKTRFEFYDYFILDWNLADPETGQAYDSPTVDVIRTLYDDVLTWIKGTFEAVRSNQVTEGNEPKPQD